MNGLDFHAITLPAVMGFAEYCKRCLGLNTKLIPLLVVTICVIIEFVFQQPEGKLAQLMCFFKGAGWGFTAVGLYSAVKNTAEIGR